MTPKTVRKILMRGRRRVFWGRRAFITVRIPLSAIPERIPPKLPDEAGESGLFEGFFKRADGDLTTYTSMNRITSGGPPDPEGGISTPHFIEVDSYTVRDRTISDYSWWEITQRVVRHAETPNEEEVERRAGPIEWLELFINRGKWIDKWGYNAPASHSVMQAFCDAATWAKTSYVSVDDKAQVMFITYSVKWFYPNRKRVFCRDLSRAVKLAKAAGVNCRILSA